MERGQSFANKVVEQAKIVGRVIGAGAVIYMGSQYFDASSVTRSPAAIAATAPGLDGVVEPSIVCEPPAANVTETGNGPMHVDVSEGGESIAAGNLFGNGQRLNLRLNAGEVATGKILTFTVTNPNGAVLGEGNRTANCDSGSTTTSSSSTSTTVKVGATTTSSTIARPTSTTALAVSSSTSPDVIPRPAPTPTSGDKFPSTPNIDNVPTAEAILPVTGSQTRRLVSVALGLLGSGATAVGLASSRRRRSA